jgi:phosphocarrier protein
MGEITETLKIKNKKGLHARAAAAFVKTLEPFDVACEVERIGQKVGGNSIMGLMMLAASKGTEIIVCFKGKDAKKAMEAIKKLLNEKFGEE